MGEEGEVCLAVLTGAVRENENLSRTESKRDHQYLLDDAEPNSYPNKKQAKEVSNEDICSEVSNPIISPKENVARVQEFTSQPVELGNINQVECGEVISTCSEEILSDRDRSGNHTSRADNDASGDVETSRVVLEIPKHASSTGIRKITFKFSKRKEDYNNQSYAWVAQPDTNGDGNGLSCRGYGEEPGRDFLPMVDSSRQMLESRYGREYSETSNLCLRAPNMQLKMSKKVVPTNVKKLLGTGILDGARVKYISTTGQVELHGIVNGGGYLCACSSCNFSRVLTAYEFEQHAGVKTRHPNNHIYLENGRPIYSIIQELKTAPLSMLDQVIQDLADSSVNEKSFQFWKESLQQSNAKVEANKNYDIELTSRLHSHASCSSQAFEESVSPASRSFVLNNHVERQIMKETSEEQKRGMKKPNSYFSNPVVQQKKIADGGTRKRDNDLHRLLFMPNGLPDGAELAYYVKGQKILGGYKQGNGIVCGCCNREISPSQFEAHAGMAARRQPYRHIYTSNGLTLHDIAISLARGQSLTTGDSDDMCAVCGDGGDLILCNRCPQSFHAACLALEDVPEGDWYCPNCIEKVGPGRKTAGESSSLVRPIVIRLTRVVKAPEFEYGGCVFCRAHDFSVAKFGERTVMLCDQCEREFHVGCLRDNGLCDLKELPKDKWFCCDNCNKIHMALQNSVIHGAEMIPASLSNTIIKKHVEKGLFIDGAADVQWQIMSGKSRYPEHLPFLSRATSIFRECFDPIVATSGRDLIPVMVYGRNISGQEFGGMYCVVLTVKSVVVSAGLLRIFGQEVAELPLVATSREHQGKGYFQALFSCIERLLASMDVQNLVLPAAEEAESIWTKKLGFRKMSEERLSKYMREVQLTIFKGTAMLEKAVQRVV